MKSDKTTRNATTEKFQMKKCNLYVRYFITVHLIMMDH